MNNIIDLAQARANRSNLKIQIIRSEKRAGGSYPFLAAATDGHDYWCKAINNPQGPEVPVNEVAAAIVGDRIQSPMPRWAILDVPDDLRGYRIKNYTLTGEPVFGSHTQLAGRPSLPAIRKEIPKDQWDLAIKSLEALDDTLFDDLKKTIPESWNIEEKMLKKIASYVLERKDYTVEQLQGWQRQTQRR